MVVYNNIKKFMVDEEYKKQSIEYMAKIVISIVILIVFYIIALIVKKRLSITIDHNKNIEDKKIVYNLIADIVFYIIMILGIFVALVNLGFQLSTLLVVFGSIGLALALAIQSTITQIVSGILILYLDYYNINDIIEINGLVGYVNDFNLLNTTILDTSNITNIVPNNTFISGKFTNYTKNKVIFSTVNLGISANNSIDYNILMSNIKNALMNEAKYIVDRNSVIINIKDFEQPGTTLLIKYKINSKDFYKAQYDTRLIVRNLLAKDSVLLLDNSYIQLSDGMNS